MTVHDRYFNLLKTWLDALVDHQLADSHATIDGAIICPACGVIHGRCADAVYPLMYMADATGDEKYLTAAKRLFKWSEYMMCDDGSMYNDSQNTWNGITVFAAVSLFHALEYHSHLLTEPEKEAFETRLRTMCEWLKNTLTPSWKSAVVNYIATNACAMAHAYRYFGDEEYLRCADALSERTVSLITQNGLLAGEGKPVDAFTKKGCRPIDIGYNVEESLPSLYEYSQITSRKDIEAKAVLSIRAHLDFMLPDGAWDNSMGSRNFKWTYYGSRTSDGCQACLNSLGRTDTVFAEAALRNLELMEKCTEGLLSGGVDYSAHNELPCVHHAFTHAKVLAQALDEGICEFDRTSIPSDDFCTAVRYYPELDTYRISCCDWLMDVTGYDFDYMRFGHASGGCVTLLYHKKFGPVITSANTDYVLKEAPNQQLSRKKSEHKSLCPRVEECIDDVRYSQMYDFSSDITVRKCSDHVDIEITGNLCDCDHRPLEGGKMKLICHLDASGLTVESVDWGVSGDLILPLIASACSKGIVLRCNNSDGFRVSDIFNLSPGFIAKEYVVPFGEHQKVSVTIGTDL